VPAGSERAQAAAPGRLQVDILYLFAGFVMGWLPGCLLRTYQFVICARLQ